MEELVRLETALRELADRLARLRQGGQGENPVMPVLSSTAPAGIRPILSQILPALAEELTGEGVKVLIAGVHRSPTGRASSWYELFSGETAEKVLQPELIRTLEALSSLERLRLMLALVAGPAGSTELMAQSVLTQGQFYHHLRILEGSGLVRRKTRDEYEATLHGVSSLFTFLAAASYILKDFTGLSRKSEQEGP